MEPSAQGDLNNNPEENIITTGGQLEGAPNAHMHARNNKVPVEELTKYGLCKEKFVSIRNSESGENILDGTLYLLDVNNNKRVVNTFCQFYDLGGWHPTDNPSKMHSIVAEGVM